MSIASDFMEEARTAVASRSTSTSHKITTMVWFTARKQAMHAPRRAAGALGSLIPIPALGTMVDAAIGLAVQKVVASRQAAKVVKYGAANPGYGEGLRKAAKSDAKDMKTLAEKLDGNMPKLKTATDALNTAIAALAAEATSGSQIPQKATMWKVAMALYERERYEDKMLVVVEVMKTRLKEIEDYLAACKAKTTKLEKDLTDEFDWYEAALEAPAPNTGLSVPGSASAPSAIPQSAPYARF
jgi:hypothetical protein